MTLQNGNALNLHFQILRGAGPMFINNRQFKILERLSKEQQPVQLQQLAAEFAVSLRTIQNDVSRINYFLRLYQLAPLKRSSRGYTVAEDQEEKLMAFLDSLYKSEAKDLILTPEERTELIYLTLLQKCNYVKISDLAEVAGVSKATLINDLNQLRQELQDWPVAIVSDRNGIKLSGDEHAIREFALNRYMEEADDSCVYRVADYYRASIWVRYHLAKVRRKIPK